jgi:hypothetical protein
MSTDPFPAAQSPPFARGDAAYGSHADAIAPTMSRITAQGARAKPTAARAPLAFEQQRFWVLDQLEVCGAPCTVASAFRLEGDLSLEALERSLCELVRRHEILRTRIEKANGEGFQVVDEPEGSPLVVIDLANMEDHAKEQRVRQLIAYEAARVFDLGRRPLQTVSLFRLGARSHVLLIVAHRIVLDTRAMGAIVREVGALYEAFLHGHSFPLDEPSAQYADYAIWQRASAESGGFARELEYWRERLAASPLLDLPTARARPPTQSGRTDVVRLEIGRRLSGALKDLSGVHGVTMGETLLAAFQAALSRWSGQKGIVVGSPVASRPRPELAGLIGLFANTVALRTDLSADPSFAELLARAREATLDAHMHRDLPFERVAAELQPQRDLSRHPIYQALLTLDEPREELELAGVNVTAFHSAVTSELDLSFCLTESNERMTATLRYATDLFNRETILRFASALHALLEAVVSNAEQRLSALPLLDEGQRKRPLVERNATTGKYPSDRCVHDAIATYDRHRIGQTQP